MLFSIFMISLVSHAEIQRLSRQYIDQGLPQKIFLSEGLVSVIEFPKNILEVRVGDTRIVKTLVSEKSPRELTLFLKSESLGATNIIVRSEKSVFVFDVVPSKSTHQDFVKVSGAFGGLASNANEVLIDRGQISSRQERIGIKAESVQKGVIK